MVLLLEIRFGYKFLELLKKPFVKFTEKAAWVIAQ